MSNVVTVAAGSAVHLPCNSGVRLACPLGPEALEGLGPFAGPFLVVEKGGTFVTYASVEPDCNVRLNSEAGSLVVDFGETGYEVCGEGGTLEENLGQYRERLEKYASNAAYTSVKPVRRIVTMDLWLANGDIEHDFADICSLLRRLEELDVADGALLYLAGWNAPYDTGYPRYEPADGLGGEEGFAELVNTAREMGAMVMPHLNYWGYDRETGLLPDYQEIQARNREGKLLGWPGLPRTGLSNPFAYIRINEPRWQGLFFKYFDPLVERYQLTAVFLDQMGARPDDPECDFRSATLEFLQRVRGKYPDLLIGAEFVREDLFEYVPLYQAWGQAWCGLRRDRPEQFSPICRLAYEGCMKFFGHLGIPAAVPSRYTWTNYPFIVEHGISRAFEISQNHQRQLGAIPTVRLNYRQFGIDDRSLEVLRGNTR